MGLRGHDKRNRDQLSHRDIVTPDTMSDMLGLPFCLHTQRGEFQNDS